MPCAKIKKYRYRAHGIKLSTKNPVWISKSWRNSFAEAKLDATLADKRMFANVTIKRQFWKNISPKMVTGTKKETKALKKTYKRMTKRAKAVHW